MYDSNMPVTKLLRLLFCTAFAQSYPQGSVEERIELIGALLLYNFKHFKKITWQVEFGGRVWFFFAVSFY